MIPETNGASCKDSGNGRQEAPEKDSAPEVRLAHEEGYRFRVRFGRLGIPELVTDEPPPLGEGAGPNPALLLAAAVGNCLASSLKFCMGRAHLELEDLTVEVSMNTARNEQGRLRIDRMNVKMTPWVTREVQQRIGRCLEVFDSYCTVTESVRNGIRVSIDVMPHTVADQPNALEAELRGST